MADENDPQIVEHIFCKLQGISFYNITTTEVESSRNRTRNAVEKTDTFQNKPNEPPVQN